MAAGQHVPDRRGDPHRATSPSAGLQQGAAAAVRGLPGARRHPAPRLRPGAGGHRPRRRPLEPGHAEPLRGRLPDGPAADAGRAMGVSHHAAPGAHREPAPRGRARGRGAGRARPGRDLGVAHAAGRRGAPQRPDPGHRRHGAFQPRDDQRVRRRVRAPPAGPGRGAGAAAHVDGAAPGRRQRDHRAPGAPRGPEAGRQPGVGVQQHRQPAAAGRHALARVRRDPQQRGADPARGPHRRVRPHGLRHPRHLPPRGGERRARRQPGRACRGPQGRRDGGGGRGTPGRCRERRGARRARGPRGLLPHRQWPRRARERHERAPHGLPAPSQPFAAARLRGRHRGLRDADVAGPDPAGRARARPAPVDAQGHHPGAVADAGHQPAGAVPRQLDRDAQRDARGLAAPGLQGRHRTPLAHAGGGAHAAGAPRRRRHAGRRAGGALPGQPRPAPAVRTADRPARRQVGDAARGRRPGGLRRDAHRRAQSPILRAGRQPATSRALPAAASPAPLERRRERVDGTRTKARQAGRPERAAAQPARRRQGVLARRGRHAVAARRPAMSSRSTPTRSCRASRPRRWCRPWPTRSTARASAAA